MTSCPPVYLGEGIRRTRTGVRIDLDLVSLALRSDRLEHLERLGFILYVPATPVLDAPRHGHIVTSDCGRLVHPSLALLVALDGTERHPLFPEQLAQRRRPAHCQQHGWSFPSSVALSHGYRDRWPSFFCCCCCCCCCCSKRMEKMPGPPPPPPNRPPLHPPSFSSLGSDWPPAPPAQT